MENMERPSIDDGLANRGDLGAILSESSDQTATLLEERVKKEQADRDRRLKIDKALRGMVGNKNLLEFLKARNSTVTLVALKGERVGEKDEPTVEINGDGEIIIFHRSGMERSRVWATSTYRLADIKDPESNLRSYDIELFKDYVEDGKALVLSHTDIVDRRQGNFLAQTYFAGDVLGFGVTADSINQSLLAGVKNLADR